MLSAELEMFRSHNRDLTYRIQVSALRTPLSPCPLFPTSKSYDALVVGMGPAGATAAYQLSRAGLSVLGLDKATHPRYKVCGGGLSARIDRILEDDYKSVVEHTIYGIQFSYRGADPFFLDSSSPIAYMVMRDRFDHFLRGESEASGRRGARRRAGDVLSAASRRH